MTYFRNQHGVCRVCGNPSQYTNNSLCFRHGWFGRIQSAAKSAGKAVPTTKQLDRMLAKAIANRLRCPACTRLMHIPRGQEQGRKWWGGQTMTLQHDRSGRMLFLCLSCNVAHGRTSRSEREFYRTRLDEMIRRGWIKQSA